MKKNFKDYRVAFGKNLKKLREGRNLGPIDLAALIGGVDPKQIYRIENAENIPSHEMIIAIAVQLGYTPSQIHDFDFDLTLNTEFKKTEKGSSKNNLEYLNRLITETRFFEEFRTVQQIRIKCLELYHVDLKSTSISIALKSLVLKNTLTRTTSSERNNHYVYKIKG